MKIGIPFVFVVFFLSPILAAASDSLIFPQILPSKITNFDIEQGLVASCVEDAFVDPKGRLWLNPCTIEEIHQSLGLYQYDGYKSFLPDFSNSPKINNSKWLMNGLTEEGNIFGYRLDLSNVFLFNPDTQEKQYFSFGQNEKVVNIIKGKHNEFYVLSTNSCAYFIYKIEKGKMNLLSEIQLELEADFHWGFQIPLVLVENDLWFSTVNAGFIRFNLENETVKTYDWQEIFGKDLSENFFRYPVRNMVADDRGNILFHIGERQDVYIFDINAKKVTPHPTIRQFVERQGDIKIWDIIFYKDRQNNILFNFIWTKNSGIQNSFGAIRHFILQDNEGQWFDYTPVTQEASLNSRYDQNVFFDIYGDDFKKKVFISMPGGLAVAEINPPPALTIFLNQIPTRGIVELEENKFLVNTDFPNTMFLVDSKSKDTSYLSIENHCIDTNHVSIYNRFINDQEGQIWFPFGKSLIRYRFETKQCKAFSVGFLFYKFAFLDKSLVVLASEQNQLFLYDLNSEKLSPLLINQKKVWIEGQINEMFVSKDGTLWIASLGGLWKINHKTDEFKSLDVAEGFSDYRMMCIHEVDDGLLWIGTFSGGLNIYNPKSGAIKVIDDTKGLYNNTVVGILADDDGDRWLATYNGITVLSKNGEILTQVFEEEGLSNKECNRYSYLKTSDGRLIFGTVTGINILEPHKLKQELLKKETLNIYLTDIRYFDKKTKQDIHQRHKFEESKRIILPATKRYIELNYALSGYLLPEKNKFSYKIVKSSNSFENSKEGKWINIGTNSSLTLNDLPAGKYNILIRGINYKGQKVAKPISVAIEVKEFFYKTYWFYLLCSLPFFVFAYAWYRRLNAEKEMLEIEVKKRTQKIAAQAEELKQVDEMKSRFFTNISHELRTPITLIAGPSANLLKKYAHNLGSDEIGMLKSILNNSGKLLNLVEELLDLSKIDSGKISLYESNVPFYDFCQELFSAFESNAAFKQINYSMIFNLPKDSCFFIDKKRMEKIINNLLSNALKFTPEKGSVTFEVDQLGDSILIAVKDTGCGISKEDLPHIFDRYFQTLNKKTSNQGGTGIGLALAKELALLMNGELVGENIPSKNSQKFNTKFTFTFPKKEAPFIEKPALDEADNLILIEESETVFSAGTASDEAKTKVLVVEDNPEMQLLIQSVLSENYQCILANDGQKAWDLLESMDESVADISLILSDIMMPFMDGFQLLKNIKSHRNWQNYPVVMLTARAAENVKLEALRIGVDDYLTKPFSPDELLARINNLIQNQKTKKSFLENQQLVENTEIASGESINSADNIWLGELERFAIVALEKGIDLNRAYLAEGCFLSERQLSRKLVAITGLSPNKYILEIKLQKARTLLEQKSLSTVAEVAYACGFKTPSYFAKVYQNHFGKLPGDYFSK